MFNKYETPEALDYLRTALRSDETAGCLFWLKRPGDTRFVKTWNSKNAGKQAGHISKSGYVQIRLRGVLYHAHRIIFAFHCGFWPPAEIDHKDGNPSNNRLNNLRAASRTENIRNRRAHKNSKSGLKGVTYRPDRRIWRACIYVNGKQTLLGHFHSSAEAAAAYREAANIHHNEFAKAD